MIKPLKLLLIASFLNGLSWIVLIPIWQYPDEQAHFAQVQDIAELGKVPNGNNTSYEIALSEEILKTERDEKGNNSFTYHPEYKIDYVNNQIGLREEEIIKLPKSAVTDFVKIEATTNPPLYYIIGAIFYKIVDPGSLMTRVYMVRIFSLLLFIATLIISYKIGELVFQKSKVLPLVLTGLIAFMPMFVFTSTGVLPDSLTNLLFTAYFYFLLKILIGQLQKKYIYLLGIIFILVVFTRQHFLILVPITMLVFLYKAHKDKKLVVFTLSGVAVLLFINFIEQYTTRYPIISYFRIPDRSNIDIGVINLKTFTAHIIWTLEHTYTEILPWYWGVYKWLSLTLPPIFYQVINRLLVVLIVGIFVYFFKFVKNRLLQQEALVVTFCLMSLIAYFTFFLVWDYFFQINNGYSFGIQGRYFFPLVVPTFVLLVVGAREMAMLFNKYVRVNVLLYILLCLMVLADDFSLAYVTSSYYDVSNIQTFVYQASQYKPAIVKGSSILLILSMALFTQVLFLTKSFKTLVTSK